VSWISLSKAFVVDDIICTSTYTSYPRSNELYISVNDDSRDQYSTSEDIMVPWPSMYCDVESEDNNYLIILRHSKRVTADFIVPQVVRYS
jgi:hypothetical protein